MLNQLVFESLPLEVSDVVCLVFKSAPASETGHSDFALTTMRSRQVLFELPNHVLVKPDTDNCQVGL